MSERYALLFADGSVTVFAEGFPLERARRERAECDRNQRCRDDPTKIASVQLGIFAVIDDPMRAPEPDTGDDRCPACGRPCDPEQGRSG